MLSRYNTILFDCDGVILNSNKIKATAFFDIAIRYGNEVAQKFHEFNTNNGGVSREKKFSYLLADILKRDEFQDELIVLLDDFQNMLKLSLFSAEITPGLHELRKRYISKKFTVVSGGNESELKELFGHLKINSIFDGGIFGSPSSKEEIIECLKNTNQLIDPVLFIGDSRYDFEVSQEYNLDFIFLSSWTEMPNWQLFTSNNQIDVYPRILDLL